MAPCPLSLTIFRSTLGQIQRYAVRSTALKHCSFTPRPYPLHLAQNLQSVAATVHRPASPKYNTHTNLFRFRSARPRFRCPQQKRRLTHCQHNKSINRAVISNLPFNCRPNAVRYLSTKLGIYGLRSRYHHPSLLDKTSQASHRSERVWAPYQHSPERRLFHSFCDGDVCFCWTTEWTGRLQGFGPCSLLHPLRSSLSSTRRLLPSPSPLAWSSLSTKV